MLTYLIMNGGPQSREVIADLLGSSFDAPVAAAAARTAAARATLGSPPGSDTTDGRFSAEFR
ncbi:MAG: hypothetical protein M9930_13740 [Anaerolineae bacterium]|nr:hypothetical protein [Anaerolineae bacterium]